MTYTMVAQIGDWTFWAWDGHPFENHAGETLYSYELTTKPGVVPGRPVGEWSPSIDRAMIAAVGEKYTGPRGAGGTGVGTAADWFARMIGMDALVEAGADGRKALGRAWKGTDHCADSVRARAIERGLENQGYVIAKVNGA
jgi:hypothetical protein